MANNSKPPTTPMTAWTADHTRRINVEAVHQDGHIHTVATHWSPNITVTVHRSCAYVAVVDTWRDHLLALIAPNPPPAPCCSCRQTIHLEELDP